MRVTTDPTDKHYIGDRPRRVWCNGREVSGWTVADEFRRIVETPDGIIHGAVLIERLPDVADPVADGDEEVDEQGDDQVSRKKGKPARKPWR